MLAMSEFEWESLRVPRRSKPEFLGMYHPRPREIEEYVALEHPRETVGWLLRQRVPSPSAPGATADSEGGNKTSRRQVRTEGSRA